MPGQIKRIIQDKLYNICYSKYEKELERQKDRYAQFLKARPELTPKAGRAGGNRGCPEVIKKNDVIYKTGDGARDEDLPWHVAEAPELVMFSCGCGMTEPQALRCFQEEFAGKPYRLLSYAHEDCITQEGKRHTPWFKPEWSPDTLEGQLYFGNIFALRRGLCRRLTERGICYRDGMKTEEVLRLAAEAAAVLEEDCGLIPAHEDRKPAGPLDRILFHRFAPEGVEAERYFIRMSKDVSLSENRLTSGAALDKGRAVQVSVVIPSRDNPEVLETCVRSVREKTTGVIYDITVVDNGSGRENRERLERLAEKYGFAYLYRPMEFNFSAMCNLGAGETDGGYLLFLNDDMEVLQEGWLSGLLQQAEKERAGAVGAKLLYPGTELIQHAGVTNLRVGPAHKLLKCSDLDVYYHGQNRGVHDMLAVTAACLLVGREKYEKAGGFFEGIKVSYNDVDFCFTLYEMGLYNIQCNDIVLYHHESLSRGDDNLSGEKWERLLQEKELLYRRHPALRHVDPFYSPYLAEHFSDYLCNYEYEYERRERYTCVRPYKKQEPAAWTNECLTVNVEHALKEKPFELREEQEAYWIEGWSYVLGLDNCRYRRSLLLLHESGSIYEAEVLNRYRKDVEDILPEQVNTALAGFVCRIPAARLPAGEYRIGMLAKDACSAQRLYRRTETILTAD